MMPAFWYLAPWIAIVAVRCAYELGQDRKYRLARRAYDEGYLEGEAITRHRIGRIYLPHGMIGRNVTKGGALGW